MFEFESVTFLKKKKKEVILAIYCHGRCDGDGCITSFFSNYHHASDDSQWKAHHLPKIFIYLLCLSRVKSIQIKMLNILILCSIN